MDGLSGSLRCTLAVAAALAVIAALALASIALAKAILEEMEKLGPLDPGQVLLAASFTAVAITAILVACVVAALAASFCGGCCTQRV